MVMEVKRNIEPLERDGSASVQHQITKHNNLQQLATFNPFQPPLLKNVQKGEDQRKQYSLALW